MAMLYILCLWLKSINACFLGLSSLQPLSRSPIYWPQGPSWCTAKDGCGLQDSDVVWWVFIMFIFCYTTNKRTWKNSSLTRNQTLTFAMTGCIALSIDELIKPTGEHIIMSSYSCNIPDGGNDMNWNIWNKSYYYINTNEIPGELSRKNLISNSRVKITYYLHVWKYHCCYGYIIDLAFHTKKLLKWNGLVVHWGLW